MLNHKTKGGAAHEAMAHTSLDQLDRVDPQHSRHALLRRALTKTSAAMQ